MAVVSNIEELIKQTLTHKHKIEAGTTKGRKTPPANQVDVSKLDHTFFGGGYGSARDRAEKYFSTGTGKKGATTPGGKFGDKYDEVDGILKQIDGLKDEVAEEDASKYSKKQLTKNQELLKRKAPAAYEKAGYGIEYHNRALEKLEKSRDNYLEKIDKAFDAQREKLGKVSPGDKRVEILNHNKDFAKQQVRDQFENAKEFHVQRRDALREFVADLEAESKISAAEYMKKGAAQVEQGVAKELSAAEHAAGGPKPSHLGYIAGGAAAGAAIGYVASDDENKARNTVIGGVIGGIAGKLVGWMKNGKSAVGAFVGPGHPSYSKVAGAVEQVATHLHR